MRKSSLIAVVMLLLLPTPGTAGQGHAEFVETPYSGKQKVLVDFYFNEPADINNALYWLRSYVNPLMDAPYNISPYDMDIKVLIHGTETVTLAKKNYKKYKEAVDRMRYYADLGVEFRICGLAMTDFGYRPQELYEFVKIAPSAMTEIVHWQLQGYAVLRPVILEKKYRIDEIR
jgi:intracellular sulfur oxidation DsrE/DsrF family protein